MWTLSALAATFRLIMPQGIHRTQCDAKQAQKIIRPIIILEVITLEVMTTLVVAI